MSWLVKIDGIEVTPYGENSITEFFEENFRLRSKLNKSILLKDTDYRFVKNLDKNIKHSIEYKINNIVKYSGEFSVYACEIDDDEQTVTVNTELRDKYTIITEGEDIEVNLLFNKSYLISGLHKSYLHFVAYHYEIKNNGTNYHVNYLNSASDLMPESASSDWSLFWSYNVINMTPGAQSTYYRIYVQERTLVASNRTMAGFSEIDDHDDYKLYGRQPSGYSTPTSQSWAHIEVRPSISSPEFGGGNNFLPACKLFYLESVHTGSTISGGGVPVENYQYELKPETTNTVFLSKSIYNGGQYAIGINNHYTAYMLKDCVNTILKTAMPSFTGSFKSTLLFLDPPSVGEPDYYTNASGHDYVTGRLLHTKYLIQKSDFKNPFESLTATTIGRTPATIGIATLSKIINDICILYHAKWYIDSDGNFRIEHVSYKQFLDGVSIVDYSNESTLNKKYSYLNGQIPNRVILSQSQAWESDFTSKEILYGNIPALQGAKESKDDLNVSFLCTDVDGANQHINELGSEGFMLIEADQSIYRDTGEYTGKTVQQNVGLSMANILHLYYRHECCKQSFTMNGKAVQALSLKKLKVQPDVNIISNNIPDLNKTIETNIGVGIIDSMEYSTNEDKIYKMRVIYD